MELNIRLGSQPATLVLVALAVLMIGTTFRPAAFAEAQIIDVVFVGSTDGAAHNGVRQGIIEANQQGEFLGLSYRLVPPESAKEPLAMIAAGSDQALIRLAHQYPNMPILNISNQSDTLRAMCIDNLLHTMPSQRMFSDAKTQWLRINPDSDAEPKAWHHTFKKYAAAQLNMRFEESFSQQMDDQGWAGWAAAKLLADTIARRPNLNASQLLQELKTNLAFDGQKGIDMKFRETGQLAQPILLVLNDKIIGEAPVRGVASFTDLDTLGSASCPK